MLERIAKYVKFAILCSSDKVAVSLRSFRRNHNLPPFVQAKWTATRIIRFVINLPTSGNIGSRRKGPPEDDLS